MARISDTAVRTATGKTLKEWFAIFDTAGAKKMAHRDRVDVIWKTYVESGWWAQMVTVEYERARGLRDVNQTTQGYSVSVHKTVLMPLADLRNAWYTLLKSKPVAAKKLEDQHSKTKRAMIRYKAKEGGVVVSFDERSGGKSRIMVEAIKLPSKESVERERAYWKKVLNTIPE
jgi:hypothetical protein